MQRITSILLASALVSGCASTITYDSNYETYETSSGLPKVDAELTSNHIARPLSPIIKRDIEIFVDGSSALRAPLHEDFSGALNFFYSGSRYLVECVKPSFFSQPECDVEIDGRRSGKIKFVL